jgi:energy-converting hydrogenase Eha subunit A
MTAKILNKEKPFRFDLEVEGTLLSIHAEIDLIALFWAAIITSVICAIVLL